MRPRAGKADRERRREEGETRNAAWRALSKEQQVASLLGRRGESRRQLAKLQP
jgi:hypothetical protein